jgi:hypothetical protein
MGNLRNKTDITKIVGLKTSKTDLKNNNNNNNNNKIKIVITIIE